LYIIRNLDSYSGTNFANFSDGTKASADIYCVSNASTDIDNGYIDLGYTGANFADTDFGVYGANCGYLWTATGDLYIGTGDFDAAHNANMYFFTGGIDDKNYIRMTITYDGLFAIGTDPDYQKFLIYDSQTEVDGSVETLSINSNLVPSGAGSGSGSVISIYAFASFGNGTSYNAGDVIGLYFDGRHRSTGTLTNLQGLKALASNDYGGNVTNAYGGYFSIGGKNSSGSTGTITNAYALYVESPECQSKSAITNYHNLYIAGSQTGLGAITNDYGIKIGDINKGSTTNYSIYTGRGDILLASNSADKIGFYGATPVAQQTGVAVTAAGIHAALVNLGLITA
jgi:hypothetical protein